MVHMKISLCFFFQIYKYTYIMLTLCTCLIEKKEIDQIFS